MSLLYSMNPKERSTGISYIHLLEGMQLISISANNSLSNSRQELFLERGLSSLFDISFECMSIPLSHPVMLFTSCTGILVHIVNLINSGVEEKDTGSELHRAICRKALQTVTALIYKNTQGRWRNTEILYMILQCGSLIWHQKCMHLSNSSIESHIYDGHGGRFPTYWSRVCWCVKWA